MADNQSKLRKEIKLLIRLIFSGIGLGVIIGTSIKIISENPRNIFFNLNNSKSQNVNGFINKLTKNNDLNNYRNRRINIDNLNPNHEIKSLSQKWKFLSDREQGIQATAFLLFLDNGKYAKLLPNKNMPAASSIKTAILLSVLSEIDNGRLFWNEPIQLKKELIGSGAGWMAYQPIGTIFPTHEVATEMIRVSDNTATNLLINRIGGIESLNNNFKSFGLNQTILRNFLPDLEGTNTTSAKDLVKTIKLAEEGNLLKSRTRDTFREVLGTSKTDSLLPGGLLKGLGVARGEPNYNLLIKGYRVYNKTGDIGTAYVDAGLIELPDMSRAIASFMVTGPFNDPRSTQLIREMSASLASVLNPKAFTEAKN